MSRIVPAAVVALLLLTFAPSGGASSHSQNEAGEDNEFGSIRVPYQLEVSGAPLTVEARILLNNHYEAQKSSFFMFAFDAKASPSVTVKFLSLETAGGLPLTVTEKQGTGTDLEKWFVDVGDMPVPGTEIVMRGEVGAKSKGFFSFGAMVVPFNYRWEEVRMDGGGQAKLYGFTQLGVNKESASGGGPRFGVPGGGKLPIPGPEAAALVAVAAAVALAARRRL